MEYSETFIVQDRSGIHAGPAGRIYKEYERTREKFEEDYGNNLGLEVILKKEKCPLGFSIGEEVEIHRKRMVKRNS